MRRGIEELPGDGGLETQLALLLGAGSDEGRRLLQGLVKRVEPGDEPSPRGRYEKGRKTELRAEQARFAVEIDRRRPRVAEAMERSERFENLQDGYRRHRGVKLDPDREVFFECRGYKGPRKDRGR